MSATDVLPSLEDHPVYKDFMSGNTPLEVVLRSDSLVEKADDLKARIREIGAGYLRLETPCLDVLGDEGATDDAKQLARTIMDGVSEVENAIAELLVDLSNTRDVIAIMDGRK